MGGVLYLATPNGLEPSTSSVTGWRANRLHHRAILPPGTPDDARIIQKEQLFVKYFL